MDSLCVFVGTGPSETIECQKHERGERTREGTAPPRVRGVLGLSPEKILNFLALLCAF